MGLAIRAPVWGHGVRVVADSADLAVYVCVCDWGEGGSAAAHSLLYLFLLLVSCQHVYPILLNQLVVVSTKLVGAQLVADPVSRRLQYTTNTGKQKRSLS